MASTVEEIEAETARLREEAVRERREARNWWFVVAGILGVAVLIDAVLASGGRSR